MKFLLQELNSPAREFELYDESLPRIGDVIEWNDTHFTVVAVIRPYTLTGERLITRIHVRTPLRS